MEPCQAGRQGQVMASTMPRAQTRTAKKMFNCHFRRNTWNHLGLINLWWYTCLIEVGHPAAPAPEDGAAGAVRDLPDAAGRDVPRAEGLRACVCCVSY